MSRRRAQRYLSRVEQAFRRAWRDDARAAQGGVCFYCEEALTPQTATADHVHAIAAFGKDERNNIVAACQPCNRLKGRMPVKLFRRMIEQPRPGEPIAYRLVNSRLRINRALRRLAANVRRAVGAVR